MTSQSRRRPEDIPGSFEAVLHSITIEPPATPAGLAALHPLWARDMDDLGPWRGAPEGFEADASGAAGRVIVLDSCASTMDAAFEMALADRLPPWASVVAARQQQGRGQLRRDWISTPGNLHVTLRLPEFPAAFAALCPLLLGYAASVALEALGVGTLVKWPNDLLTSDGKAGGILVEERRGILLAGMGLNLSHAPKAEDLRRDHALAAGVLRLDPPRGPLCTWLVMGSGMRRALDDALAGSPHDFLSRLLRPRLAFLGRRVRVVDGSTQVEGIFEGLAEDGSLRIDRSGREGEMVRLYSGSVYPL